MLLLPVIYRAYARLTERMVVVVQAPPSAARAGYKWCAWMYWLGA